MRWGLEPPEMASGERGLLRWGLRHDTMVPCGCPWDCVCQVCSRFSAVLSCTSRPVLLRSAALRTSCRRVLSMGSGLLLWAFLTLLLRVCERLQEQCLTTEIPVPFPSSSIPIEAVSGISRSHSPWCRATNFLGGELQPSWEVTFITDHERRIGSSEIGKSGRSIYEVERSEHVAFSELYMAVASCHSICRIHRIPRLTEGCWADKSRFFMDLRVLFVNHCHECLENFLK